jgi:hypothetical protein
MGTLAAEHVMHPHCLQKHLHTKKLIVSKQGSDSG